MGRLRNSLLVLLLGLMTSAAALPQTTYNTVSVSGVVLSEGRNQRLEHVNIHLCDSGGTSLQETITSDSGDFYFRGLQRLPYILTFDASGYEKYQMHLDLSFMSDRGMTIYLKPIEKDQAPATGRATISAHELSMPETARNLVVSGKKKIYMEKKPDAGLKDLRQAVSVAPSYYEAYCEIAMAYLTLGNRDEAVNNFRKSIEVSHDSYGEAEVGLGTLLVEKGDTQAGEQDIRRGVQLNPSSWMGFYELGKLDLNRGQMQPALESAEHAKSLAPNAPVIYRLLANIHLRQENYTALLEDIDAYIKLDPDSPAGVRAKQMREEIGKKVGQQKETGGTAHP